MHFGLTRKDSDRFIYMTEGFPMHGEWPSANRSLSKLIAGYRDEAPQVAAAFSSIAKAAIKPGSLDSKTKELMALAVGIATRCDGSASAFTPKRRSNTVPRLRRSSRRSVLPSTWAGRRLMCTALRYSKPSIKLRRAAELSGSGRRP